MDQPPPAEAHGPPPCAPGPDTDLPEGFTPLRLLLQPGGLCVELARPDMLFGRHSAADVRLALPDVSRRHCRFVFRDGHWAVVDLDSLNGTHVNGERLAEAVLCHGDTVRIGSFTFAVDRCGEAHTLPLPEGKPGLRAGMLRSIADILPLPEEHERRKAS
jgi:pSer/pThr/pTyr-binding forkhead associated (FHA) protein